LTVFSGGFYIPAARPVITSVVSTADGVSPVATGGLATIFGTNLSGASQASGFPLATNLGNACITANGEKLPMYYASPTMVNAQIPYDITGSATLVVRGPAGISDPFSLTVQPAVPVVFSNTTAIPGTALPYITRQANGLLATPSNPVHTTDILQILVEGMGQTSPPATAGIAPPANPVETVVATPTVTIGGANANVLSANLVPGVPGVYQVDVQVNLLTPLGLSEPLVITQGSFSQTAQVRVVK
jgi:uncharacterized protein (TIGR03437 family)